MLRRAARELMRQNSEKLAESFTDGEGKTTHYEYGAFDLLTALVRPDGERLTCRYDKLTRLTEITNAAGERYCLKYDKAGQLVAETDFTGRTLTYTYDAAGRCIRTSFPDGTHLNRRYNVTDQLTDEEVTHGESNRTLSTTTFRYDTQCRLVEAKNDAATVIFEYNDANQIVAETLNGRRTEYGYDPELDTVTQRTSAGITERFTYDKNLNITRRQTWVNEVLESETHQQLRHGRVVSREHKGWRHQMHRINPDTGKPEEGKFVRVVNAHNITWKYDINGRLVEKLVDKGGYRPLQWRYRWDAKSQLTGLESLEGERWRINMTRSADALTSAALTATNRGWIFTGMAIS